MSSGDDSQVDGDKVMRAAKLKDDEIRGREEAAEVAWRGIELCRQGDWEEGLYWLSLAVEAQVQTAELPGLIFSYLGYGIARYQGQTEQGLKLCQFGARVEMHQAESYYFLAKTHLLLGDKRSAYQAIEGGLQVDAAHPGLEELTMSLGQRRPPVLPFLSRRHSANRWLGKLRHRLFGSSGKRQRSA